MSVKYSATELARIMYNMQPVAARGTFFAPTAEQIAVIESPLEPSLVIAGAGSGKTKVLAARVLYLVANRIIAPEEILGLTFTRKAAGELAERINHDIHTFRRYEQELMRKQSVQHGSANTHDLPLIDFAFPTVQTYNSYAASLVNEYGLLAGISQDSVLLDDAAAVLMITRMLNSLGSTHLIAKRAVSTHVNDIVTLAGELADHLRSTDEVRGYVAESLDRLATWEAVKADYPRPSPEQKIFLTHAENLFFQYAEKPVSRWEAADREALFAQLIADNKFEPGKKLLDKLVLLDLIDEFEQAKRRGNCMQFADQVKLAHLIVDRSATVKESERSRWKVVLLDEYQDTSDSQYMLLGKIFKDLPVMAVGDPRQAIYGWRGASSQNVAAFPGTFASDRAVQNFTLSTGFRNPQHVLTIANAMAALMPGQENAQQLQPRPGSGMGHIEFSLRPAAHDATYGSEHMRDLVEWVQGLRATEPGEDFHIAVLCRKKTWFAEVANALQAAGVPYQVIGAASGLDDPFVAEIFAVLNVIADPQASEFVYELLTGRLCQLGLADMKAFRSLLQARNARFSRVVGEETAAEIGITAVEVIDEFHRTTRHDSHFAQDTARSGLSEVAVERIGKLSQILHQVREANESVTSTLRQAEWSLRTEAEIVALPAEQARVHRMSVDMFHSSVQSFLAAYPHSSLGEVLNWLAVAEEKNALERGDDSFDKSRVTIMTIHGSKGLEFDAVAVAHMEQGQLPTTLQQANKTGWLGIAQLPYALRRDANNLPTLDFVIGKPEYHSSKEFDQWRKEFFTPALQDRHESEERRLAYVAITRAKKYLWLGSELAQNDLAKQQEIFVHIPYLTQARQAMLEELGYRHLADYENLTAVPEQQRPAAGSLAEHIMVQTAVPDEGDYSNEVTVASVPWPAPADPVAQERRTQVRRLYEDAIPEPLSTLADTDGAIATLATRAHHLLQREDIKHEPLEAPRRLATTALVSFAKDKDAFVSRLQRPMPSPPNQAAALGTAFHAWVEQYYGQASLASVEEAQTRRNLPEHLSAQFDRLRHVFLESKYAHMQPDALEVPFELSIGDIRIPGKIDAVFSHDNTVTIVDWKSGKKPSDTELTAMRAQLMVYALAIAGMEQYEGKDISAEFYFVGSNSTITLPVVANRSELADLIADLKNTFTAHERF